jgi:cation transport regulator ChaB
MAFVAHSNLPNELKTVLPTMALLNIYGKDARFLEHNTLPNKDLRCFRGDIWGDIFEM